MAPPASSSGDAWDQAAAWFARHRRGLDSATESAEFEAWLRADPSHAALWQAYVRTWERLDAVRDVPQILHLRESARRRVGWRNSLRQGWRMGVGVAAASLMVAGAASWWALRSPLPPANQTANGGGAGQSAALRATLVREASTQIGERSLLVLMDGSRITLNTATALRADFTGGERRVVLVRGEAFFDVAPDAVRPFVVTAGSRNVTAVGTAFNVRLQDRQMKVTLLKGRIRVTARPGTPRSTRDDRAVVLEPGFALVATSDGTTRVERLDVQQATSWRTGKLVFEDERLADVVAEMNRYSRQQLVIANPVLRDHRISGVFEPRDAPAFAAALEVYGIVGTVQHTESQIVLDLP